MEMLQTADLVMRLDNVIAVAAAAKGNNTLLMLGLAISIPMVVFGSAIMIKLMARFPIIVTFGACLIGWVGGETIVSDVVLREFSEANPWLHYAAATVGALSVLAIGKFFQSKQVKKNQTSLVDLTQAFVAKPTPRGRLFYVLIRVFEIKINHPLGTP